MSLLYITLWRGQVFWGKPEHSSSVGTSTGAPHSVLSSSDSLSPLQTGGWKRVNAPQTPRDGVPAMGWQHWRVQAGLSCRNVAAVSVHKDCYI